MKKKKNIRLVIVYGILLLLAGYFLPREVEWSPSFSKNHSIPYGCEVLFNELPHIIQGSQVKVNNSSLYQIRDNITEIGSSLIIIDENIEMDSLDVSILLDFISEGNVAFISSFLFPPSLSDSLHFKVNLDFMANDIIREGFRGTYLDHNFYNSLIASDSSYAMKVEGTYHYFENTDSTDYSAGLGWVRFSDKVNFLYYGIGKGYLFLHSNPFVFTNYNILEDAGRQYVSKVFSFLPEGNIIWDEYYKEINRKGKGKTLEVVLAETPLRWALYLSVIGILLALLFLSKRRQRIIPVLDPYTNDSKDLVETIGNLYYNTSENNAIVSKKLNLLRQELFRRYKTNDLNFNASNIEFYRDKTGIDSEEISTILQLIAELENAGEVSENKLTIFNTKINKLLFKR